MMNILINDSNSWVAQGICALLESDNKRLITCSTLQEGIQILRQQHIDVLITELMSEKDDVEQTHDFLCRLESFMPGLKVIILTKITDIALINFYRKHHKNIRIVEKNAGINSIKVCFNYKLGKRPGMPEAQSSTVLSRREFALMKWFGGNYSQQEIAQELRLHPKTVSYYKRSLFNKLHCKTAKDFFNRLSEYGMCKIPF